MITYNQTLHFLYGLQARGIKFGLRNVRMLLRTVGDPHKRFPSIHVAGTNGKGSTASYIASVFVEAGYRTGLYTSPHLVRFTERIRINGSEIPEAILVGYARHLRPSIEAARATFFEATTCIAFQYFADQQVDIAVIETGLGGRLDATNLVLPEVSVITSIGFDHTELLGTTIRSIAREKGGIIKVGTPVVTSSSDPNVVKTLRSIAVKRGAGFYRAGSVVRQQNVARTAPASTIARTKIFGRVVFRPGLEGDHQLENARLAVAALDLMLRKRRNRTRFRRVTAEKVRRGIRRVVQNTGIRGRLEAVGRHYLVDVAHNPGGLNALVRTIRAGEIPIAAAVFGVMKDKDWRSMLRELAALDVLCIMVAPSMQRALSVRKLCDQAGKMAIPFRSGGSVGRGIRLARTLVGRKGRILIAGSHYVAGEALAALERRSA